MPPVPTAQPALRRLLARLGEVDVADALEVCMLLAELREQLEALPPAGPAAADRLAALDALICAAEVADILDRTALLRLLQLDLADVLSPRGLAA